MGVNPLHGIHVSFWVNYFATKLELIFTNFGQFCKRLKIMTGEIIVLWVIVFYRKWRPNAVPYYKREGGILVSITAKVRQSFGNESLILVQDNGFKVEDTDTTRGKFFWRIWHSFWVNYFATKLELIFTNFGQFCKRLKIMTGEIIVLWVIVFYRKWRLNAVPYYKGGGGILVSITAKVRQGFGNESLILVQANGFKVEDTDTTRGKFYWRIWHIEISVFSRVLSIILSTFLVARNRLYIWPSITRTLKWDKAIDRTKNQNVSKQQGIELSNMNFYRFSLFGTGDRVQLIDCLNKGLYGVRLSTLQLVKLLGVNCMIHFVEFLRDLSPLLGECKCFEL